MIKYLVIILIQLLPSVSSAETGGILTEARIVQFANPDSIEALSHRGNHFEAVSTANKQDKQLLSVSEALAAARSSWALGLADEARDYWIIALADPELSGAERYRAVLASAILELQEKNFDRAREIAERATLELDSSEIRSQFYLVIADSLKAQNALGLAEQYYQKAVDEAAVDRKMEALYLLAECQYLLGKLELARKNFVLIETSSIFSTLALNRLAEIDLNSKNFKGVSTWIEEGRRRAPSEFRGPWQSYAYIESLLGQDKLEEAKKEIEQFKSRSSEDNHWYVLSSAAIEGRLANSGITERAMLRRQDLSKEQ